MRALASRYLAGERAGHTLDPTALVHEAYLKLVDHDRDWNGRQHFVLVAARAMRQILVDHARARGRLKRGGDGERVTLDLGQIGEGAAVDLLAVDDVLRRLSELDERKGRLVELRFFAGMTEVEAADALGVARSTAAEDWRLARAWLHRELEAERE